MAELGVDRGLKIHLDKSTRPGSGLGSSAASAAAAVVAVDALLSLNLSQASLVHFAAAGECASAGTAHADNVAASICGGFTICGVGEPMRLIQIELPDELRFVIATPRIEITTLDARQRLPKAVSLATYSDGCSRCAMMVAALSSGDLRAFGELTEGSFVDTARSELLNGFGSVAAAARAAGAFGVSISGGGPSVSAVADASTDLSAIAAAMENSFRETGVKTDVRIARAAGGAEVLERHR